ncbi:hypothetical protein F5141DRAFT_1115139 [Pisolithus sp. B1]|nr:hypothetical protein F5141DRAFT_1115139 [Pisolithus sp. B1]
MLTHRDFSAWIVSNNQPLPEYLVAVDEKGSRVSCWIPSEAGKQFSVHWRDHGSNVHTCSFISLDGFVVPGRFLYGTGSASREGVRSGPTSERPFIFAEYRDASSSGDCNRNAGTIMLKIKRVRLEGHKRANPFQTVPDGSSRATISGHCVGYGDERPTYEQSPSTWQIKPYDRASKGSYVTFVFRYRPREFLLSQGIISVPQRKARPSQRRVTSAPVATAQATGTLITPSPSPSPNTKKMETMNTSVKAPFFPGLARHRTTQNVRTVSMNEPRRNVPYPGEGILELFPLLDPRQLSKNASCGEGVQENQESQSENMN